MTGKRYDIGTVESADDKEAALAELRKLLFHLTGCRDGDNRDLVCTPCGGNYGHVEVWVVAVRGTPARGLLVIGHGNYIFFIDRGRCRHLGSRPAEIVSRFSELWLPGPHVPLDDVAATIILGMRTGRPIQ